MAIPANGGIQASLDGYFDRRAPARRNSYHKPAPKPAPEVEFVSMGHGKIAVHLLEMEPMTRDARERKANHFATPPRRDRRFRPTR